MLGLCCLWQSLILLFLRKRGSPFLSLSWAPSPPDQILPHKMSDRESYFFENPFDGDIWIWEFENLIIIFFEHFENPFDGDICYAGHWPRAGPGLDSFFGLHCGRRRSLTHGPLIWGHFSGLLRTQTCPSDMSFIFQNSSCCSYTAILHQNTHNVKILNWLQLDFNLKWRPRVRTWRCQR